MTQTLVRPTTHLLSMTFLVSLAGPASIASRAGGEQGEKEGDVRCATNMQIGDLRGCDRFRFLLLDMHHQCCIRFLRRVDPDLGFGIERTPIESHTLSWNNESDGE